MGDREDPARLVFTSKEGHGIATSLIDLGNRFRLIINDVAVSYTHLDVYKRQALHLVAPPAVLPLGRRP